MSFNQCFDEKNNVQRHFYTPKPYTVTQNPNRVFYSTVIVVSLPS